MNISFESLSMVASCSWRILAVLIVSAALGLAQEKAEKSEKQDFTSAVAVPPMMNAPDFQRMLVQLSSDSSGWKTWTQAINASQAALDEKKIGAIDARKTKLSGFLELVTAQTGILAQKESIEGDNRLLMGLQSASEAAG